MKTMLILAGSPEQVKQWILQNARRQNPSETEGTFLIRQGRPFPLGMQVNHRVTIHGKRAETEVCVDSRFSLYSLIALASACSLAALAATGFLGLASIPQWASWAFALTCSGLWLNYGLWGRSLMRQLRLDLLRKFSGRVILDAPGGESGLGRSASPSANDAKYPL